jgi:hypothetical protein
MTLDRGFPAPATLPRDHPGIVVLKLRNQSAPSVEAAVMHILERHPLEELWGCIVIVASGRISNLRPS